LYANTVANNNTSIGESAMIALTTGDNNTGVGNFVLNGLTTGFMNTAIGKSAGQSITTGTYNTIIGANNSPGITTGSYNTIIGSFIFGLSSTLNNNIILADGAGNIKYRWDGSNNNLYGNVNFNSTIGNGTYTYTLPSATGTLALTSDLSAYVTLATTQTISGAKTFSAIPVIDNGSAGMGLRFKMYASSSFGLNGYMDIAPVNNSGIVAFAFGVSSIATKLAYISAAGLTDNTARTFTLPDASGTLALTSNLSSYLPLSGGTLTGALNGTSGTFSSDVIVSRLGVGGVTPGNVIDAYGGTAGSSARIKLLHAFSDASIQLYTGASDGVGIIVNNNPLWFDINGAERMRIATSGATSITATAQPLYILRNSSSQGQVLLSTNHDSAGYVHTMYITAAGEPNGAATGYSLGKNSGTNRSINAGGTINASGADYAEYMIKAIEDDIAKGDIVGIDENGLLTNIFENSISFVVKSTDPSYIGGDTWFNEIRPLEDATQKEKDEFEERYQAARAKVDRIAFSGQVPCNVYDAQVGDYIIAVQLEDGKIGGQAIANPTFEQYQISVGKVWKIMDDGRAWVAVKIG
jgi:hypothetical protein